MKYRINWTENVGYYADIEADSKEEAIAILHEGSGPTPEPCGFCEVEVDSIEATPLDEEGE